MNDVESLGGCDALVGRRGAIEEWAGVEEGAFVPRRGFLF
jgi:hypothetical protein